MVYFQIKSWRLLMENQAQNLDVQLRSAIKGSQNVLERYKKLLLRLQFSKGGSTSTFSEWWLFEEVLSFS